MGIGAKIKMERGAKIKMGKMLYKGKFVFNDSILQGTILLEDEKITEIHGPAYSTDADVVLDYQTQPQVVAIPGLIDPHTHFRGFNLSYKEDEYTGTRGAVKGGYTTIVEMPNTQPKMDRIQTIYKKLKEYEKKSFVDYGVYAGVPSSIENLEEILEHFGDIMGFKIFPADYSNPCLKATMDGAYDSNALVILHAEDPDLMQECETPGERWKVRTIESVLSAINKIYAIVYPKVPRMHLAHASSAEEVLEAKRHNYTVETIPYYLLLGSETERKLGSFAKIDPPLRPQTVVQQLVEVLKQGGIDAIGSDHAPHTVEEKSAPFIEAPSGVPGVEVTLPLMLTMVNWGWLTLPQVVRLTSTNPASILGLERVGKIAPGYVANLTIVDLKAEGVILGEKFESKCKHTPFENFKHVGSPITTILHGDIVCKDGEIFAPGHTLNVSKLKKQR